MRVQMTVKNRVLAFAKAEGRLDDAAGAMAKQLREQFAWEDRVYEMLKMSIVPVMMILALPVIFG